jgi:signal transduction histidine kinase/class 3 adenylate cyclase
MSDETLRRELAYYKRHLDELAAQRISLEHHQWGLNIQLGQKRRGFQLLSQLARSIAGQTDLKSMLRIAVLAMNSALGMDRTVIFAPTATLHSYVPAYFAGVPDEVIDRVARTPFVFPPEFGAGTGLLLAHPGTEGTPLISALRESFGLESFVCLPIVGHGEPVGIIFSGRVWGHQAWAQSAFPALDQGDVDTFQAITGILQAIVQNTRLALLEQTERLKTQFFADVAHEFRTPLTLTLGPLAQILAGKWGELPPTVQERLRIVERNQERLLVLINQILDLARLEAGAAEIRATPIADVNDLVRDCAVHFRPAAEARGLELRLTLDPTLPTRPFFGDREKIERVLFNLLSNALKFTEQGHIEVITQQHGDLLELAVEDTGVGIPEADLQHVFDRFRRVARVAVRSTHGSGIGLALVKQMVELHGGHVVARSRKGSGSRFTVTLPVKAHALSAERDDARCLEPASSPLPLASIANDAVDSNPRAAVDAANRRAEAVFDAARPIVLYVEDDSDLRAHVHDILAGTYNLFLACDGVDGLERARRYLPDVILTDQMMPRMNGREFLLALRDDPDVRSIPVVFLTAQYGTEGRIESLDAGADDYITKPFGEAELRARLRNLVRARRHERDLAEMNARLETRVREQVSELVRKGELERFVPRAVVDSLRSSPDARGGPERRQVTVLVTELCALSEFADRLDDPGLARLADEYLGAISVISAARGGTIDGLTGGRVSILFGAPLDTTPEDAATAAFQAALEIRAKTAQLGADARRRGLTVESGKGIGLASGRCLVGAFGNETLRAYTAIGSATRAAAAMAEATPCSIVCDHATWSLLKKRVHARPLDPAKGNDGEPSADRYELGDFAPPSAEPRRPDSTPPGPSEPQMLDGPVFRREGEFWTVAKSGRVFRLRDSKGALYLARLLARPHREIHVLDLGADADPDGRPVTSREAAELGLHAGAAGHAGAVLDRRAKSAYRKRLEDLDEELREATSFRDPERIARAESEKILIARELATAVGLGGRDRKAAAAAERFRVNVTRAVKAVLQKIAKADPELGRHLAVSVRTGNFCCYAPPPGTPDAWNIAW